MIGTSSRPKNDSNTQLNCITSVKGRRKLGKIIETFLDYCTTHPNTGVMFHAIDMIPAMHSDGS